MINSKVKYIGHNTYTGRRINLLSKPALIHVPAHTYDFNYSCWISHFSWLTQAVPTKLIYRLSQKVGYAHKIIDPVINGFSHN